VSTTIIPFPSAAWRDTLAELAAQMHHLRTAELWFLEAISERRWLTAQQLDDLHLLLCNVRQRVRVERWRAAAAGGGAA
jgi:hypothetical protein